MSGPADPKSAEGERTCPHCGRSVPHLRFCVRCGRRIDQRRRATSLPPIRAEPARALRLFSTLFPHLPRRGYDAFRHAFSWASCLVVGLVIAGLYPVALVAAAIVVPILFVLYFLEVDLYERAPLAGVAATLAWGARGRARLGRLARLTVGSSARPTAARARPARAPGRGLAVAWPCWEPPWPRSARSP